MNKKIDLTDFKLLQFSSGAFLSEQLPDNWEELSEEAQEEFLNTNVWDPLDNFEASELLAIIDSHADCLRDLLNGEWRG